MESLEYIYEECKKRWNDTHDCIWEDGDPQEKSRFYIDVEREFFEK